MDPELFLDGLKERAAQIARTGWRRRANVSLFGH